MDCSHHYSYGAATLTNLCHKNVLGNVVYTKVTLNFLKLDRMISALALLISKSNNRAECVDAIDANEVIAVGVLL